MSCVHVCIKGVGHREILTTMKYKCQQMNVLNKQPEALLFLFQLPTHSRTDTAGSPVNPTQTGAVIRQ